MHHPTWLFVSSTPLARRTFTVSVLACDLSLPKWIPTYSDTEQMMRVDDALLALQSCQLLQHMHTPVTHPPTSKE